MEHRRCAVNAHKATAQHDITYGGPTMSQQETVVQAAPEMSGSAASSPAPPQPQEPHGKALSGWWVLGGGILVVLTLGAGLVATTLPRLRHEKQLKAEAAQA